MSRDLGIIINFGALLTMCDLQNYWKNMIGFFYIRFYRRQTLAFSTGRGGRLHLSLQVLDRPLRTAFVLHAPAVAQSCTLPKVLSALNIGRLDGVFALESVDCLA